MASLAVSASVVQAEAGKTHTSNGSSGDSSSSNSSSRSSSSSSSSNGVTTTTNGVTAAVGTMRRPAPKVGAYQAAAAAAASNRSAALLYPLPQPYDTGLLAVDAAVGHILYYEQCGNPRGAPVLYIHGTACKPYVHTSAIVPALTMCFEGAMVVACFTHRWTWLWLWCGSTLLL